MQNENFFSIAELDIKICFAESPFNGMHLIPSLEPFREKNLKGELFFQLSVDDTLSPISLKFLLRRFALSMQRMTFALILITWFMLLTAVPSAFVLSFALGLSFASIKEVSRCIHY